MLNIAICDNDIHVCNELERILYRIQDIYDEEYHCEIYDNSKTFVDRLKRSMDSDDGIHARGATGYHIIFLDIEMPEISGIEVARYIREKIRDEDVMIVFISSYTAYALQLFEVHPLDFIIKPVTHENVQHLFEKAYRIMGVGHEYFSFKYNREQNRILIANILYFESVSRKIIIHTTDGEFYFYEKLAELLNDRRLHTFIQIHKSLLVNYKHVARFRRDSLELNNGEILPISQQNRKDVMNRFLEMESN